MSYNSLFGLGTHSEDADLKAYYRLQDNAASTVVVDDSSSAANGTLTNAGNTSAISVATGPTSWLPRALNFDGTNDFVDVASNLGITAYPFTLACFCVPDVTSDSLVMASLGRTAPSGNEYMIIEQRSGKYSVGARNTTLYSANGTTGISTSVWRHIAGVYSSATSRTLYVNGTSEATNTVSVTLPSLNRFIIGKLRSIDSAGAYNGRIAGVAAFNRVLTQPEIDELRLGPEPLNTIVPTFTISTTTWTGTTGTWDSQSNGTITYAWELRDADDDSVVESGTGSSPSGLGSYSGDYYLWVRASNDGGYDTAEDSVSADETATGGGGAYTLVCDQATFTETGQDVELALSRRLASDQATYTETGQDANVLVRRLLTSDNASYTLSGQDAAFTATGSLVGDVGTFALTGQDANLVRGRTLTADFVAFVSIGQDASLARSRILRADQSAFTLSGQDATLTKTGQASLTADYVTFSALGQDATLTYSNAPNVPYLELDFTSNNAATGSLTALSATGSLVALQATGTLVVTDTET